MEKKDVKMLANLVYAENCDECLNFEIETKEKNYQRFEDTNKEYQIINNICIKYNYVINYHEDFTDEDGYFYWRIYTDIPFNTIINKL